MRRVTMAMVCGVVAMAVAAPSWALDRRLLNDIRRAETSEDLAKLSARIADDAGEKKVPSEGEATRLAAETTTYLTYILVRQNELLLAIQQPAPATK